MKKEHSTRMDIHQRIKQTTTPPRLRRHDDGKTMARGQLWSVSHADGINSPQDNVTWPSWLVILLDKITPELFNAVPIFRWTELAGPDDVIIPRELGGADFAVAMGIEATVHRDMLGQCHGRLPNSAVDFICNARTAMDNVVARHAYIWGPPWLGPHDHRKQYAEFINNCLEELQTPVRRYIWGSADTVPPGISWETVQPLFDQYPTLAAADTGQAITPCIRLSPGSQPGVSLCDKAQYLHAISINFDKLIPDNPQPICCEWRITENDPSISQNAQALIFDARTGQSIGQAAIYHEPEGCLLIMNVVQIQPNALRIDNPGDLRIVIVQPS